MNPTDNVFNDVLDPMPGNGVRARPADPPVETLIGPVPDDGARAARRAHGSFWNGLGLTETGLLDLSVSESS